MQCTFANLLLNQRVRAYHKLPKSRHVCVVTKCGKTLLLQVADLFQDRYFLFFQLITFSSNLLNDLNDFLSLSLSLSL